MKNYLKIVKTKTYLIILFLFTLIITNCGKKSDIEPPPNYQKPKFDKIFD